MNSSNNKLLWIFALVLAILPLRLHCDINDIEEFIKRVVHNEPKRSVDQTVDNAKYQENINNVIQNKINYYKSEPGIEEIMNSVISGSSQLVFTAATIALVVYLQMIMLGGSQDERMQIYYPGQIKLKFSDVAGLSGAKADMRDIISYLKNPKKYKKVGAKVPKGVLMNGGPGNGKTLLAKAFAGEVNVPFISINGSSFVQMYVGMGALRVRELFKKARDLAWWYGGCIIFIDEIDSLTMQRSSGGGGGNSENDSTLNALLAEMDGLSSSPIIVLGATNRAKLMDEAVKRPGRFDRKVEVSKPNIKDRVQLLHIALRRLKKSSSIDIERIALGTRGFSGAELANLINEAAILTANGGRDTIEDYDIELAFDNITLGREIMGMDQSDDAKRETALHEAGHTMALIVLDKKHRVHKSSIVPRSNTLGVMRLLPLYESYSLTKDDMLNDIIICLSGRLAEEEFGLANSTGAHSDLQRAHSMAYAMVAQYGMSDALRNISYSQRGSLPSKIGTKVEDEIQKIIDECTKKGKDLMKNHRQDIEKIANLMMEKGTVLGEEIYNLLNLPMPQARQNIASHAQSAAISAA